MRIESSLRGIFTVFFRQFGKFVFTLFFVVGSALGYLAIATPIYESSGSILINFGTDAGVDVSASGQGAQALSLNDRKEMVESYTKILQSHDVLLGLINEFGADKLYPKLAGSAPEIAPEIAYNNLLRGDLIIKNGMQGNIIEIRMQNSSPKLAPQFLHRLLEQFITRQSDVFNKPETNFIQQQVKHSAEQLEIAQKKLQDFKETNGLSSVEDEMNRLMVEKSDAKAVALRSIDEAQTRVDELKARETQLLLTYNHDSPSVIRLRESLNMARGQLAAKQADLKAGTIDNGLDAASTLAPHIKDINKRMKLLETQRGEYNDLFRLVKIAEDNYRNYVNKLEEARLKETLNKQNITRISILDEPTIPLTPVSPNKKLILVLSLMGGLILAVGMVVAFEGADERFYKPEQLTTTLGVPVMASFSQTKMKKKRGSS